MKVNFDKDFRSKKVVVDLTQLCVIKVTRNVQDLVWKLYLISDSRTKILKFENILKHLNGTYHYRLMLRVSRKGFPLTLLFPFM